MVNPDSDALMLLQSCAQCSPKAHQAESSRDDRRALEDARSRDSRDGTTQA